MLFADTDLASQIERAECQLLSDCAQSVSSRHPDADVFAVEIGGGIATFTGVGSPFNKVAGLGFDGPLDGARLAEVEREFDQRSVALQVEVATLAEPSIGEQLTRRGYELKGYENVLGRRLKAAPTELPDGVEISRCEASDFSTWLDVVVEGFSTPDTQGLPSHEVPPPRSVLDRMIGDMVAAEGFSLYLASRNGEPAGGGTLRINDKVAQLCGAATVPQHRRRGIQSALLAARLEDAARAGCEVAVVTTQPGSKSQENVQRQQFQLLYSRAMLVRAPANGS